MTHQEREARIARGAERAGLPVNVYRSCRRDFIERALTANGLPTGRALTERMRAEFRAELAAA